MELGPGERASETEAAGPAPEVNEWPVESWLLRAVELDPQLSEAWYRLGLWRQEQERVGQAIADWQRCLRVDPGHMAALLGLATVLVEGAAFESARTYLDHALGMLTDPELRAPFEDLKVRLPGGG